MRRSKSRNSSLVFPSTSSFDFSSQRSSVYTDRQAPIPLLTTAPLSICARKRAGTAMRPFASTVCSYSPRNICSPYQCLVVAPAKYLRKFSHFLIHFAYFPHSLEFTNLPHFPPL